MALAGDDPEVFIRNNDDLFLSLAHVGAQSGRQLASPDGSVVMADIRFPPSEGDFADTDFLCLYLGLEGTGRIVRRSHAQRLEATVCPGRMGFNVPGVGGMGAWDRLCMLVLGVDLRRMIVDGEKTLSADDLAPQASRLHDDPLMSAVLTAIWRDAAAHGLSSAFFDHGLMLIAKRLASLRSPKARPIRPLAADKLARIIDRIEEAVAADVSVAELAYEANMSPHHFSRAFKAATGLAPYQYLTHRRIARAQTLLRLPGHTVLQVALMVGFANPSQFAAAFRAVCGQGPSAWRKAASST